MIPRKTAPRDSPQNPWSCFPGCSVWASPLRVAVKVITAVEKEPVPSHALSVEQNASQVFQQHGWFLKGSDAIEKVVEIWGCSNLSLKLYNLVGGFLPPPLKNMLVKLDHFPKDRGEDKKICDWNHSQKSLWFLLRLTLAGTVDLSRLTQLVQQWDFFRLFFEICSIFNILAGPTRREWGNQPLHWYIGDETSLIPY